ncbi:MAG: WD40 repeat domain-containing protein [Promethearchaeota archaeon]
MSERELFKSFKAHDGYIRSIVVTPDGNFFISGSDDKTIKIWELLTGNYFETLTKHTHDIECLTISQDGKYLFSGSNDLNIMMWDIKNSKLIKTIERAIYEPVSIATSPEGNFLAIATNAPYIEVWDWSTGRIVRKLEGHDWFVPTITFSTNGKSIISGSEDETIKIWDLLTGKLQKTLTGHENTVFSLATTLDGKYLISSSADETIRIWSSHDWGLVNVLKSKDFSNSLVISPDSRFIIAGLQNKTIEIWDILNGILLRTLENHKGSIESMAISPDGKYIISGDSKGFINIWNFQKILENLQISQDYMQLDEKISDKEPQIKEKLPWSVIKEAIETFQLTSQYCLINELIEFLNYKIPGLNISDSELKFKIMEKIKEEKLNIRIHEGKVIFPQEKISPPLKTIPTIFNPNDIQILRGGDWKIEGNQSVFYFKVKVKNDSNLVVSNIQILLTSIPKGLHSNFERYKIELLKPGSFESPTFKLKATESCVGDKIEGIVTYTSPEGKLQTIQIEPFEICYVCNLLTPKEISRKDFEEKIDFMEEKKIIIESDLKVPDLEKKIAEIVKNCNFALLEQLKEAQSDEFRKIEAFAEGLYDKQDVALSIAVKEVKKQAKKGAKKGSKLVIRAMSDKSEKITDLLKDLSIKMDDIKNDTELIKEYTSQIEDIFDRIDDLEAYLVKSLGSDFQALKFTWKEYKEGKIGRGKFIKEGIKILGKTFVKKIIRI